MPLLGHSPVCSLAALATWAVTGHPSSATVVRETGDLLRLAAGPLHFEHHLACTIIRLDPAQRPPDRDRHAAGHRVRDLPPARRPAGVARARARAPPPPSSSAPTARDTLSFFKLRADKQYFFSDDRRAFVGYRIENGVLLLSGDPVGPPEAFPGLLDAAPAPSPRAAA